MYRHHYVLCFIIYVPKNIVLQTSPPLFEHNPCIYRWILQMRRKIITCIIVIYTISGDLLILSCTSCAFYYVTYVSSRLKSAKLVFLFEFQMVQYWMGLFRLRPFDTRFDTSYKCFDWTFGVMNKIVLMNYNNCWITPYHVHCRMNEIIRMNWGSVYYTETAVFKWLDPVCHLDVTMEHRQYPQQKRSIAFINTFLFS